MKVSRAERTANYVILGAFALFALIPILTILQAALGPSDTAGTGIGNQGGALAGLHLENFTEAWQVGHFGQYMRMSFMVSQDERFIVGDIDQVGQLVRWFAHIDVRLPVVVEDAELAGHAYVDR